METKKKWYQKTWGIFALLVLFFPAGLYLMWKYSGWKPVVKWIISGFFALVILGGQSGSKSKTTSQPTPTPQATSTAPTSTPKPSEHELDATVKFSDVAFMITNNESKEWTNCKLELNAEGFKSGYVYKTKVIPTKDALIVPFREFTKGDGTRFNPYDMKAKSLSISCEVDGVHGFNYFGIQ